MALVRQRINSSVFLVQECSFYKILHDDIIFLNFSSKIRSFDALKMQLEYKIWWNSQASWKISRAWEDCLA